MSPTIECHREQDVATLVLNRPQVLNAMNDVMAAELHRHCRVLEQDDTIRCVVMRGAGDGFMAGGDVAWFQSSLEQDAAGRAAGIQRVIQDAHGAITCLRRMPKPVLASVHGAVAGFGVSLVAACDLALAATDTIFKSAYQHLGTSPDGGLTWALPRITGMKRAMEFSLLDTVLDAAQAEQLGLVNRVLERAELEPATRSLAVELAAGATRALGNTKQLLHAATQSSLAEHLQAEAGAFIECAQSADFAEGVGAFCARRAPRFTGC